MQCSACVAQLYYQHLLDPLVDLNKNDNSYEGHDEKNDSNNHVSMYMKPCYDAVAGSFAFFIDER